MSVNIRNYPKSLRKSDSTRRARFIPGSPAAFPCRLPMPPSHASQPAGNHAAHLRRLMAGKNQDRGRRERRLPP